jgi:hypothetical protein
MDTVVLPLLSSSCLRFSVSPSHACYCSNYLHPPRRGTEGIHPPLLLLGVSFEISPFSWGLVVTLPKPKFAKIGCIMHWLNAGMRNAFYSLLTLCACWFLPCFSRGYKQEQF